MKEPELPIIIKHIKFNNTEKEEKRIERLEIIAFSSKKVLPIPFYKFKIKI